MTMIHLAKDKHVVRSCEHGNKASRLSNYVCWVYYHLQRPTSAVINSSPWREVSAYPTPWSVQYLATQIIDMCDFESVAHIWSVSVALVRVGNNGASC
jgi:hypothetical protein